MAASSPSTLSLAGRLRTLGDTQLAELITARGIRDTGIRDFFDLADALLDPTGIQHGLARLSRQSLAALAVLSEAGVTSGRTADEVAARLTELGSPHTDQVDAALREAQGLALADVDELTWHTFDPVARQLRSWPTLELPSLEELAAQPPPSPQTPGEVSRAADGVAAENAFHTTTTIASLVAELRIHPARELAKGGIAAPDGKRLAAALSTELDQVQRYLSMAERADLVALDGGGWLATAAGEQWLLASGGERWARLAEAWLEQVPANIRSLLSEVSSSFWGSQLVDYLAWLYPAGGEWMRDRALFYTHDAELLGVIAGRVPSTPGRALLEKGAAVAEAAMTALLPAEIDRVYVQHDLSIVSPGPLKPALDARLRRIADVENRALATTYRITEFSLERGMSAGETAETVRELLSTISLTGIPQPLDYLITTATARHGLLRVGALDPEAPSPESPEYGARGYLRSEDASLLGTVLVDQNLYSLDLKKMGPHRAVSRFDSEVLYWALLDARYPVAAEDAYGTVVALERRRVARARPAPAELPAASIIRKLRFAGAPSTADTGQAWLERQLDAAAKGKLAVTVTVRMPDDSLITLDLEPMSVAGGRLRAIDRTSDLERTLPLSSITGVSPASQQ